MINEIGMDFGSARIECTAKPITHAFIHFMNDGENKKITRSMDAEERFHNKRIGYVKYCIHTRHNIVLSLISLNWTSKHVSVKGQIVVKTCQSGSLKFSKYQDVEDEGRQKTHRKQKAYLLKLWRKRPKEEARSAAAKQITNGCGFVQHEHGRPDGWTSTRRGSDDEKKCSEQDKTAGERLQNQRPHPLVRIGGEEDAHEIDTRNGCSGSCDLRAGERLPKQRPLGDEHPERNPEEQLVAQVPYQGEEAGSIVLHSSSNVSEFMNDNKEARVTTSAAAKESEEFLDKDAEILRLIEERRSMSKEEKQRLKDLSKSIKICIREKKE